MAGITELAKEILITFYGCVKTKFDNYYKCPRCGYYAFDGSYCWDCGYSN